MGCSNTRVPENTQDKYEGDLYYSLEKYKKAAKHYKKWLNLKEFIMSSDQSYREVYYKLAICYMRIDKNMQALKYLKRALSSPQRSDLDYHALKKID